MGVEIFASYELEKTAMKKHTEIVVGSYDNGKWMEFMLWCRGGSFDNLLYLEPLSRNQFYDLLKGHSLEGLCKTLIAMENYRPIIKNKSIYLTAKNWLNRSKPKVHQ